MIAVLAPHVIDQIAAGEVIERPASVVKELADNAIDAGASSVAIDVAAGGRALVRVSDDGCGMSAKDAVLALERHATSKLREVDDLWGLTSMGFRGEALPSIASVSRMTLTTRRAADDAATRVTIEAGRLVSVTEVGAPVGTTVEVADLLHNIPARLKFLKGEATEASHVTELVAKLAMAYPRLHIRLRHNGRTALDVPPDRDGFARAQALLGPRVAARMFPVSGEESGVRVTAYLGAPELAQATARGVQLFVGRRPVRDRGLLHALAMGYGELVARGRYPVAIVLVDVPAGAVDVNVHPQKLEVRFSDAAAVTAAVRHVVQAGITAARWRDEAGGGAPVQLVGTMTTIAPPALPFDGHGATPLAERHAQQMRSRQGSLGFGPAPELAAGPPVGARNWARQLREQTRASRAAEPPAAYYPSGAPSYPGLPPLAERDGTRGVGAGGAGAGERQVRGERAEASLDEGAAPDSRADAQPRARTGDAALAEAGRSDGPPGTRVDAAWAGDASFAPARHAAAGERQASDAQPRAQRDDVSLGSRVGDAPLGDTGRGSGPPGTRTGDACVGEASFDGDARCEGSAGDRRPGDAAGRDAGLDARGGGARLGDASFDEAVMPAAHAGDLRSGDAQLGARRVDAARGEAALGSRAGDAQLDDATPGNRALGSRAGRWDDGDAQAQDALYGDARPVHDAAGTVVELPPLQRRLADGTAPIAPHSTGFFAQLRYLGQLDLTYLACEGDGELVLIDQHAAHERVELARLRARHAHGPGEPRVAVQNMLFPVTIEATPAQLALVARVGALLAQVGFEVEPFGKATLAVKAVPAGIRHGEPAQLLRRLLANWAEAGVPSEAELADRFDALLGEIACHSVVRAGDRLSPSEAETLLHSLDGIDLSLPAPHGRAVLLRLPLSEIGRRFGR